MDLASTIFETQNTTIRMKSLSSKGPIFYLDASIDASLFRLESVGAVLVARPPATLIRRVNRHTGSHL